MIETNHRDNPELTLSFSEPADNDTAAVILGNGRLGAMVYGRTACERIALNDDTLWTGGLHQNNNPRAAEGVARLREAIVQQRWTDAERIAAQDVMGRPSMMQCYQPLGNLELAFPDHDDVTDYTRDLDLQQAVAHVRYRAGDTTFCREVFVSHPANTVVVRLTADRPGALTLDATLVGAQPEATTDRLDAQTLCMSGQMGPRPCPESQSWTAPWLSDGLAFEALLTARCDSGTIESSSRALHIRNADSITLLVAAATSYIRFDDVSGNPHSTCIEALSNAVVKPSETLLTEHVTDHRALFDRVSVQIDTTDPSGDNPAMQYQFGRYLLIAASRPGSQAANLQGIWSERLWPFWGGKYTVNINIQMNYWPVEVGNLPECHLPLVDLIADLAVTGAETARAMYGCDGWMVHHNTDAWRLCAPVDGVGTLWTTGGAWLATHLFEHYLFTGDRAFLARRGWPLMREAARFCVESLIPIPDNLPLSGRLVTCPSSSPETGPPGQPGNSTRLTYGSSIDLQIIHHLLTQCIEVTEILDCDEDFRTEMQQTLDALAPLQIGKHGQLQEWIGDWDDPERNHHHVSHLYGMFPGDQLAPEHAPTLAEAARVALTNRHMRTAGFPGAWRASLWARLKHAEQAHTYFRQCARGHLPNMLESQMLIDAPAGTSACVAEMLLQSHVRADDDSGARVIELLPALPEAWPGGRVRGFCARGGFLVSMEWRDGALIHAEIVSNVGGTCHVRYRGKTVTFDTDPTGRYWLDGSLRPA